jgi:exonuclease III
MALQTTFIFLSDIRLNTSKLGGQDNLFSPNYNFYHNSTRSSRGVGILISNKLQYSVIQTFSDNNDNILGIRLQIGESVMLLLGVYGPNQNNDNFFVDLDSILKRNRDTFIICAGDWNLTYCTDPSINNIDIINMQAPPSSIRSDRLAAICEEHGLMDPYRLLHFKKREFTYVPRHGGRNRSRIDFFLVSDNLLSTVCVNNVLFLTLLKHCYLITKVLNYFWVC